MWAFELPGHFRAQCTVVGLVTTLGFAALRAWRSVLAGLFLSGVIAAPVLWLWVPHRSGDPGDLTLDVLSLNVSFYGRNQETVSELIRRLQPDIVGLVEIDRAWVQNLKQLGDLYPHRLVEPPGQRSGTALVSKFPLTAPQMRPLARTRLLAATVHLDRRTVVIGVIHTASPVRREDAALRNEQMQALYLLGNRQAGQDLILMGDFNTSPWSLAFRRLTTRTRLRRNTAVGFGYRPTWPVRWPLLGIPIDHCLVSDGVTVKEFETAGPTGSGHLAIHARLGLRPGT